MIINDKKERHLIIKVFNAKGESLFEKNAEYGKTNYSYTFVHEGDENIIELIIVRGVSDVIWGIDEWKIDINSKIVDKNYQLDLNKKILDSEIFCNAYNGANKINLLEKTYKSTPKNLQGYVVTDIIFRDNKTKIFIIERLPSSYNLNYQSTSVFAKEIILLNLDSQGKIDWGTLINRNLYNQSNAGRRNVFIGGAKGIQTISYADNNILNMLNWTQKGTKYKVVHRKFDLRTGKLTFAKILDDEKIKNLNCLFTEWLSPNVITLLNMQGIHFAFSEKKFDLQVVELDQ